MMKITTWIPTYTEEEYKRLRTRMLVILSTLLAVSVVLLQLQNPTNRAAALLATFLMLVSLILVYRGHLAFPRIAVPVGFLFLVTTFAANGSGLRDAAIFGYFIVISMSGLLLGEQTILVALGVTIVAVFGIYGADQTGLITTTERDSYGFADATYISAYLIIGTVILRMIITNLNKSIQEARQSGEALTKLNTELEDRIQRRTKQVEESRHEAQMFYGIAEKLNSTTSYTEILQGIMDEIGAQPFLISLNVHEHFDLAKASYVETPAIVMAGETAVTVVGVKTPIGDIHRQPDIYIEDMNAEGVDPAIRDFYLQFGFKAVAGTSIRFGERLIGSIVFTTTEPHVFTPFERNLLRGLGDLIASATERSRLFDEIVATQSQTELLYLISQDMNAAQDYVGIVEAIARHLAYEDFQLALALYEHFDRQQATYFDLVAGRIGESEAVVPLEIRLHAGFTQTWTLKEVLALENIQTDPRLSEEAREYYLKYNNASALVSGVLLGERVVGALHLTFPQARRFSTQEMQIWRTLGDLVAAAIERVRLYTEQVKIADELLALDQMKSQFLASMSHELRTPLNAILNFSEFINLGMLGPVTEQQQDALGKVLGSGKHLLTLINDVLDMTKIQSGMMTLFVEADVDVNQEVETVCAAVEPLFQDRPVQFIRDIDADLPKILGDRRRIRQILFNLLSNAAKFTDEGSVTLSVKYRHSDIMIVVSDTGPGIALEDQTLVFEPFRQTETGIQHAGGTGLGLPISRKLSEAHGGKLWVESLPNEGATFYVTLPCASPHLAQMIEGEMELVHA